MAMVTITQPTLSTDQRTFYRENGYLLVEGLLSRAEAAEYRRECHDLARRLSANASLESTWKSAQGVAGAQGNTMLLGCHNVQFYAAAFSRLIVDERLTGVAAALIDGPNVQLHHTKMFIKPPEKGSPFPLHQDHPFFPHERHSMIAAIVHFDDAPVEKGCVCVVPGSHTLGPLEHNAEGNWHLPVDRYPLDRAGGRRAVLQLSDHPRLRRQRQRRGADHGADPDAGSARPSDGADARVARPGYDAARYRPRRRPARCRVGIYCEGNHAHRAGDRVRGCVRHRGSERVRAPPERLAGVQRCAERQSGRTRRSRDGNTNPCVAPPHPARRARDLGQ
jgi:hypothetical protein